MKESTTYQAILEEGRTEGEAQGKIAEARKLLRFRGEEAFGPADTRIIAVIEQLNDLTQLEALFQRVRSAGSWQELFDQPAPRTAEAISVGAASAYREERVSRLYAPSGVHE